MELIHVFFPVVLATVQDSLGHLHNVSFSDEDWLLTVPPTGRTVSFLHDRTHEQTCVICTGWIDELADVSLGSTSKPTRRFALRNTLFRYFIPPRASKSGVHRHKRAPPLDPFPSTQNFAPGAMPDNNTVGEDVYRCQIQEQGTAAIPIALRHALL